MKKMIKAVSLLLMMIAAVPSASADDKANGGNVLQGLFDKLNDSSSLGKVGDVIQSFVSTADIEMKDLVGTWAYTAPAVSFKSDDLLKKAGGAAAASTVEDKLQTYYKMARIQSLKLTIGEDSTFTMKFNRVTLKGDITKDEEGNFFFNYKAAGKIKIGTIQTYLTKSGNTLNVVYDVSKLMTLIDKVGTYTGNSTVKGVSALLNGYDGITAGFKLTKQQ